MPARKIIVIRGPAGSGKSTVTHLLLQKLKEESKDLESADAKSSHRFAYLEQDYFRNTIAGGYGDCRALSAAMMLESAKVAIESGYHVIMEGILNINHYKGTLFDPLIEVYGIENVIFFYLDASLALTQERHLTREKANEFGGEKLSEWYSSASPSEYSSEVIIPAASHSADAVVELIRRQCSI